MTMQNKDLKLFCGKKEAARYYWFHHFMKRYLQLSVKKAENLSAARAMAVNET